nr:hypothetical protein [Tanacetum cinerariifolium]
MSLFNQRECVGCGQPCDGFYGYLCPLNGGFCSFCALRAGNSFAYDPNPNSFDDSQNLSDYPPQPQYETYLCELCGNDSHYGYDCPPLFPLIYEQEPSYNQNYDDNYYPRKVDEGFLVGYSVCSKAFRVFNSRTRIVQETLHCNFIVDKSSKEHLSPCFVQRKFDGGIVIPTLAVMKLSCLLEKQPLEPALNWTVHCCGPESDSSPHAHAQSIKTYYKHHDSIIKKAQDLNTKTFANSDIQDLPLRYQDYQGRLLASFQEDANGSDYGVPTLSTLRPQQICLKVWLMRTSLTFLIQEEGLMSQMFLHLTKRISRVGKLDHDRPSDVGDTKIAALRLKFNAFKSLEGEKDSDSDVEEDQRTSNEFMAGLNAEYHERALLANQKRFYKRSGRVGSARKTLDKTKETCFACGKLECLNSVYGDGKPITCNECGGILSGGFCLPCNLKAVNSYNSNQDAYSFNNNSNYLPQPQYENYLCNLCENNSHDGYDCQQQFPFVYEQEPSYNQNYDDNYYPHYLPSFPHCDNCGGSHETFQCQPITQNIDFFGYDQIQTPQYPEIHPPSQEISDEVFQTNHSVQYKENLENSSNSNQEKEGPPQDSDIRQLIREECCVEVSEEQKQSMEDTMLELVKIYRQKEFLCIHDNVEDLIKCALNTKLLSINSQRLENKEKEVKNVVEQPAERENRAPILSTKEPEHSLSMGYEHLSITPETKPDEVTESNAKNLLPIPSECEVTSEDKRECDMPVCEDSSVFDVCDNHSEIFSDSKNDDDISVYDDDFEDIEYVEASLPDPEIVSVEGENVVQQEEEEVDLEDIYQIQDVVLREKLLSITRLISNIESLNDNPTPDCERLINVVKNDISDYSSNDLLLKEADLFLASDNSIPPGIENVANDSEGDIRFLEELLIDDSILSHESSDSYFEDIPSIPRPPPEPPDAETDVGEEIPVVMKDKDKFNEDYSYFMFDKVFFSLRRE